jgi:uncharacterized protein YggE
MTPSPLALMAMLGAMVLLPGSAAAQEHGADPAVLHVNGRGVVEVEPDRARLSFAVETEAEDARSAAAANAELMEAVIAALRGTGDSELSLETMGYNLIPMYERNRTNTPQPPRIVGYRVVNQVQAVTGDLDGVGELVDAGLGAGSNRISGLAFFLSDPRDAQDEAYRRAVADALRQARAMAAALGVELGPVEEVRGSANPEQPRPMGDMMLAAEAAARTPVEAGSTSVTASVSIRFKLGG